MLDKGISYIIIRIVHHVELYIVYIIIVKTVSFSIAFVEVIVFALCLWLCLFSYFLIGS